MHHLVLDWTNNTSLVPSSPPCWGKKIQNPTCIQAAHFMAGSVKPTCQSAKNLILGCSYHR